jgi:glycosyltransferase involved in cell wall biosynthesis
VRSAADFGDFVPRPEAGLRRRLALPEEGPLLFYLANYHPDEAFLISALEKIFAAMPDVKLAYTGPAFNDPRARRKKFGSRLWHLGRIPYECVPEHLAAADVLLLPLANTAHNRARLPQKLLDYMASGRPIVSCNVGELGRIFEEHPGIGKATPAKPEAFGAAATAFLRLPNEEREKIGAEARRVAEENFTWDAKVAEVDAFLRNRE